MSSDVKNDFDCLIDGSDHQDDYDYEAAFHVQHDCPAVASQKRWAFAAATEVDRDKDGEECGEDVCMALQQESKGVGQHHG